MELNIVTGATGHIGNVLVKHLLYLGKKVKVLLLPNEDLTPLQNCDVEISYGSVLDKEFLLREITENSIVFHLAGIIDISSQEHSLMYEVNVNGTKNMVDVCELKNVKKFIYTSSVHTIQSKSKNELLTEPDDFDEDKIVGEYAKTKVLATKYIIDRTKNGKLNSIIVYPSGVVGPYDYKMSNFGQLIWDYMNKKIYARINGAYNFVDVRDVANGIILAAENGKIGEGYILSGQIVQIKELFEWLEEKTGYKKPPRIAMWFVKMFAKLAEYYYSVRHKKPLFSKYSLYTLTSNYNFSNKKAKDQLNFTPRNLKETVFDAVDWFQETKNKSIDKT